MGKCGTVQRVSFATRCKKNHSKINCRTILYGQNDPFAISTVQYIKVVQKGHALSLKCSTHLTESRGILFIKFGRVELFL